MIGQVISQTLGLPMMAQGFAKTKQVEAVLPEETGQSHNQSSAKYPEGQVQLSAQAQNLSKSLQDSQPNWQQVQALAAQLSSNMDSLFLKAGIDTSMPIRINIHPFSGIPFVGEHPDKERIQALLNDTPDILSQIKHANSIASYSYQVSQTGSASTNIMSNPNTTNRGQSPINLLRAKLPNYSGRTGIPERC